MARLREISRDLMDVAREGIAWFIIWREGRSWKCLTAWPENFDYSARTIEFDAYDYYKADFARIHALDSNAQLLNSYYFNLGVGCCEEAYGSAVDLERNLRYMYDNEVSRLDDWAVYWKHSDDLEDRSLTDKEVQAALVGIDRKDPLWIPAHYPLRLSDGDLWNLCSRFGGMNSPIGRELCRRAGNDDEYDAATDLSEARIAMNRAYRILKCIPEPEEVQEAAGCAV